MTFIKKKKGNNELWIALLATLMMSRSQSTREGLGNMICIRGWRVLKIRRHPPPPPLLTFLVPKTHLKKFLTYQDLQEVLGPQKGEQSPCKEIFTLESAQQLASVSPQMVSPHEKGFSFPKPQSWGPVVTGKLQVTSGHNEYLAYTGGNTSHCCDHGW